MLVSSLVAALTYRLSRRQAAVVIVGVLVLTLTAFISGFTDVVVSDLTSRSEYGIETGNFSKTGDGEAKTGPFN